MEQDVSPRSHSINSTSSPDEEEARYGGFTELQLRWIPTGVSVGIFAFCVICIVTANQVGERDSEKIVKNEVELPEFEDAFHNDVTSKLTKKKSNIFQRRLDSKKNQKLLVYEEMLKNYKASLLKEKSNKYKANGGNNVDGDIQKVPSFNLTTKELAMKHRMLPGSDQGTTKVHFEDLSDSKEESVSTMCDPETVMIQTFPSSVSQDYPDLQKVPNHQSEYPIGMRNLSNGAYRYEVSKYDPEEDTSFQIVKQDERNERNTSENHGECEHDLGLVMKIDANYFTDSLNEVNKTTSSNALFVSADAAFPSLEMDESTVHEKSDSNKGGTSSLLSLSHKIAVEKEDLRVSSYPYNYLINHGTNDKGETLVSKQRRLKHMTWPNVDYRNSRKRLVCGENEEVLEELERLTKDKVEEEERKMPASDINTLEKLLTDVVQFCDNYAEDSMKLEI